MGIFYMQLPTFDLHLSCSFFLRFIVYCILCLTFEVDQDKCKNQDNNLMNCYFNCFVFTIIHHKTRMPFKLLVLCSINWASCFLHFVGHFFCIIISALFLKRKHLAHNFKLFLKSIICSFKC